jgi:hypothetical protein
MRRSSFSLTSACASAACSRQCFDLRLGLLPQSIHLSLGAIGSLLALGSRLVDPRPELRLPLLLGLGAFTSKASAVSALHQP